jgi:hypothetical protein
LRTQDGRHEACAADVAHRRYAESGIFEVCCGEFCLVDTLS